MAVSRLLKSCATPPASRPTASIFADCRSCASSAFRSVMSRAIQSTVVSTWSDDRREPRGPTAISPRTPPPPSAGVQDLMNPAREQVRGTPRKHVTRSSPQFLGRPHEEVASAGDDIQIAAHRDRGRPDVRNAPARACRMAPDSTGRRWGDIRPFDSRAPSQPGERPPLAVALRHYEQTESNQRGPGKEAGGRSCVIPSASEGPAVMRSWRMSGHEYFTEGPSSLPLLGMTTESIRQTRRIRSPLRLNAC